MNAPIFADASVHHVCLSVPDRDAAARWWGDMFGFEPEFTFEIAHIGARGGFLRKGAMRIELFEVEGSAPAPLERRKPNTDLRTQGVKHVCFVVGDVQGALERAKAAGVAIVGVARGVGAPMREEADVGLRDGRAPATAFFLTDPWGALIEVLGRADFAA
ncbi:MAG: VOC family protein [Pseudomonadota bacterium]|nr:VOC family protein [Pseudomonadota bacterium]